MLDDAIKELSCDVILNVYNDNCQKTAQNYFVGEKYIKKVKGLIIKVWGCFSVEEIDMENKRQTSNI